MAESTTEPFSRKYITREQPRAPIDAPAGGADRFILLEHIYSKPSFLSISFSRAERILKQKNARLQIFMARSRKKVRIPARRQCEMPDWRPGHASWVLLTQIGQSDPRPSPTTTSYLSKTSAPSLPSSVESCYLLSDKLLPHCTALFNIPTGVGYSATI